MFDASVSNVNDYYNKKQKKDSKNSRELLMRGALISKGKTKLNDRLKYIRK
jgi:hypothetical protein